MDGLTHFLSAIAEIGFSAQIIVVFWATLLGITVGMIPGLTATLGVALVTTLTFAMEQNTAILVLICVYIGAIYGGGRTAILLNIPGDEPAMMTTLDGQFTPGTYNPLRFTFLIWVMVIVGGSGNNLGAVLGGFLIWFIWVEAEPVGRWIVEAISANMDPQTELYRHLQDIAAPFRLFMMGLVLLIVMRFSPRGILPEKVRHS